MKAGTGSRSWDPSNVVALLKKRIIKILRLNIGGKLATKKYKTSNRKPLAKKS